MYLNSPASKDPVTPEMALNLGLAITTTVASWFYLSNQRYYQRAAIDREDLEGHLRHYILTQRYLPTVEKNPGYYTEDSYRKSLYVACKKACYAHHRKHIASLKRGLALKDGAAICLDEKKPDGYEFQLAAPSNHSEAVHNQIFQETKGGFVDYFLVMIQSGYTIQDIEADATNLMGMTASEFQECTRACRRHILEPVPC